MIFILCSVPRDKFDFTEYTFILDANILMRLMKINNEHKCSSIQQFINKAKEIGVSLVVTSFTKEEVESSIAYQLSMMNAELLEAERKEARINSVDYKKEKWIEHKVEKKAKLGESLKSHKDRIYLAAIIATITIIVVFAVMFYKKRLMFLILQIELAYSSL